MSRKFNTSPATTDVVTIAAAASINNLTQFTWMARVKPSGFGPFTESSLMSRKCGGGAAGEISYVDIFQSGATNSGIPYSSVRTTNPGISGGSTAGAVPLLDSWQHVAMSYDNAGDRKVYLYLNGVFVSQVQVAATGVLTDDDAFDFLLGQYASDAEIYRFIGLMGDFRLYNTNLTQDQIVAISSGDINTDPAPASLVCQLTFATDQGSTEPDASGNGNDGTITGATFDSENPPLAQPSGAVFPGPYFGDTFAQAFTNPEQLDVIQVVNQGGSVIWKLDYLGVATFSPSSATSTALLARVQGNTFAAAFSNPSDRNILQVLGNGGAAVWWVNAQGFVGTSV